MVIGIFKKMHENRAKFQNFNAPNYNLNNNNNNKKSKLKASCIEKETATRDLEAFRLLQREAVETQDVCFLFPKLVSVMEENGNISFLTPTCREAI